MSVLTKKASDSDVESQSSWTLLSESSSEENDISPDQEHQKSTAEEAVVIAKSDENNNDVPIEENKEAPVESFNPEASDARKEDEVQSLSSSSSCSLDSLPETQTEENATKQGCLTLDEYLAEKELSHDYDYDVRAESWEHLWDSDKRGRRKYKKCKAENLTTLTVVGAVLSIAGISLMCMMTPFFGRQFLSSGIQNQIEENFTRIDSPYATANNMKVYINNSDKIVKVMEESQAIDPYVKQCCKTHAKNTECRQETCKENEKREPLNVKPQRPMTFKEFLKEKALKRTEEAKKYGKDTKNIGKSKNANMEKISKTTKTSAEGHVKINGKIPLNDEKKIIFKEEQPKEKENGYNKVNPILKSIEKKLLRGNNIHKERKSKMNIRRANRYLKSNIVNESIGITRSGKVLSPKPELGQETTTPKLHPPRTSDKIGSAPIIFKETPKVNETNFVLVNKKVTETAEVTKRPLLEKVTLVPDEKASNKFDGKQKEDTLPFILKAGIPKGSSSANSWHSSIYRTDIIACQLLQDICILKLTSKLRQEAKSKQKRLKRRLEKKKLRHGKTTVEVIDNEEEEKKKQKSASDSNVKEESAKSEDVTPLKAKSQFELKPKIQLTFQPKTELSLQANSAQNNFTSNSKSKRFQSTGVTAPSNFDLLKELPFMAQNRKEKNEKILKTRSTKLLPLHLNDKGGMERGSHIPRSNLPSAKVTRRCNNSRRSISFQDMVNSCETSRKFLENARKKNEEKLRLLEQMKLENRLKMEEIIRERRERMRKDASLGIYNVTFPKYAEISEELGQLKKNKRESGFALEALSSSDSESEKLCVRNMENKISCELMTALKVGKKVSDSFREWTLKKAPTLTCLKNYCTSKVTQISERLTNQCINQTNIESTVDKEEIEALKSRKEKHEQLKRFWRAKQEYLDRRIEICELLKKKLSSENIPDQSMSQGVQILDSIINDVLKSVKNSKSCTDRTYHTDAAETRNASKSAVVLVAEDEKKEKDERIVQRQTFAGSSDDLYKWLFERRAMEIRKRDQSLWNPANCKPGHAERKKEMSKQDPFKGYHDKIIKKHN